ncbi:dUTP diphosphatase [Halalkalibacter krulwichiae]|uniref:dUTPase n=1 Tax=Halalkalibacter krulwichiae TaxID=199441 RepID=A0A1X9M9C7_9BACI|nr:dUTP diphosphatase [Halalkalibacter krulwichiae]ARK28773.1 dUTPase [Halalkalibacter krulwichiae]
MNLQRLFEKQRELKEKIDYEGIDKYEKLTLAFIVEMGECANDWRGFKYWSRNTEPKETLLEEYVDGLHFALEKGIELLDSEEIMMLPSYSNMAIEKKRNVTEQFKMIILAAIQLEVLREESSSYLDEEYTVFLEVFLGLGEMLGFTWEQIERGYLDKNKVNHARQESGY